MQSTNQLFGPQLSDFQSAMSRATKRQALLTQNMANVNTPGYKRKDIDFDVVLQGAMNPSKVRLQEMVEGAAQEASDSTSIQANGNNVDMESEVVDVSETQLRFQALSEMTANYFSDLKSVIREGR